MGVLGNVGGLL